MNFFGGLGRLQPHKWLGLFLFLQLRVFVSDKLRMLHSSKLWMVKLVI